MHLEHQRSNNIPSHDQAIKLPKQVRSRGQGKNLGRSNIDPSRGCQYSRYISDHPLRAATIFFYEPGMATIGGQLIFGVRLLFK